MNPAPIAYQLAQESHADPKPFMVGLAICISTSFCTPVAHETTIQLSDSLINRLETDFLYPQMTWLTGAGTVINLGGAYYNYNILPLLCLGSGSKQWHRRTDVRFRPPDRVGICDTSQTLFCFPMSLREDRNWATKIYQERAEAIDANENVTYFFLKNYQEICRYMRTIGYGSKGKAETVEKQVAGELEIGRYCSLRTTVRGRQSTQDIAFFIYRDLNADFLGSGLVVVTFDTSGELAKEFADAWFQKADAFMKESLSNNGTSAL